MYVLYSTLRGGTIGLKCCVDKSVYMLVPKTNNFGIVSEVVCNDSHP